MLKSMLKLGQGSKGDEFGKQSSSSLQDVNTRNAIIEEGASIPPFISIHYTTEVKEGYQAHDIHVT